MKRVSTAFHRRMAIVAASAAALTAGVAVLRAAHTPPTAPVADTACTTTPAAPEAASAGLRVAIDPETGQLGMPVDGGIVDLVPAGKAGAVPTVEVLADGTQILHTHGQHRHYATVQLNADGKLETGCTQDAPAVLEVR